MKIHMNPSRPMQQIQPMLIHRKEKRCGLTEVVDRADRSVDRELLVVHTQTLPKRVNIFIHE